MINTKYVIIKDMGLFEINSIIISFWVEDSYNIQFKKSGFMEYLEIPIKDVILQGQ